MAWRLPSLGLRPPPSEGLRGGQGSRGVDVVQRHCGPCNGLGCSAQSRSVIQRQTGCERQCHLIGEAETRFAPLSPL